MFPKTCAFLTLKAYFVIKQISQGTDSLFQAQHFVFSDSDFFATERYVEAAVAHLHLTRRLASLVKSASNVQGLTIGCLAAVDSAFWKISASCELPNKVARSQDFEVLLRVLLAAVTNVRSVLVRHHLGWDHVALVERAAYVDHGAIGVNATSDHVVWVRARRIHILPTASYGETNSR